MKLIFDWIWGKVKCRSSANYYKVWCLSDMIYITPNNYKSIVYRLIQIHVCIKGFK